MRKRTPSRRDVLEASIAAAAGTLWAQISALKLLKADPAVVITQSEEIKARYTKIFGV